MSNNQRTLSISFCKLISFIRCTLSVMYGVDDTEKASLDAALYCPTRCAPLLPRDGLGWTAVHTKKKAAATESSSGRRILIELFDRYVLEYKLYTIVALMRTPTLIAPSEIVA